VGKRKTFQELVKCQICMMWKIYYEERHCIGWLEKWWYTLILGIIGTDHIINKYIDRELELFMSKFSMKTASRVILRDS
jgi:hypothetical protein